MLIFLDETFDRNRRTGKHFGALCGIAIPESRLHGLASEVYQLKRPYFGDAFAKDSELKGKELLTPYAFKMAQRFGASRNVELAREVLQMPLRHRINVFGVVCFNESLRTFRCNDPVRMDVTFRYMFERINLFMRQEHPEGLAKLVFDDRGYRTNANNVTAITNFFLRSAQGKGFDSILRAPFFAVSQAQNVGLQLADVLTTVVGKVFKGDRRVREHWRIVQQLVYYTNLPESGPRVSSLKVIR